MIDLREKKTIKNEFKVAAIPVSITEFETEIRKWLKDNHFNSELKNLTFRNTGSGIYTIDGMFIPETYQTELLNYLKKKFNITDPYTISAGSRWSIQTNESVTNEGSYPPGVSGIIGNIRDIADRYIRSHKNATTGEVVNHILDTIEKLPDGNMKNVSKDTIEKLVKDYNLDENIEKETDVIDLRKKESEDDVYVLIYNGSEDAVKKAASAIGRKPNIHKGNSWYFRYPTEKDARAAWAKSDEKSFEGKFTYKKLAWKDWKNVTNESIEKETDMIDLREKKTSKHEDDMEIKFVNKGDEFKSEKADDVKIVDIEKKDDKTEVTYKLGDEEKKNDIEDVLKMLNGAEYKKVDDKKDEKKACEDDTEEKPEEEPVEEKKSCKEDNDETDSEETPDKEELAKEKKEAEDEKDPEDDEIEVTLDEDFHVPGTDIILEKGDVIRIIPRKDN